MRRTLIGAALTAALLIPATAAQAGEVYINPSPTYRIPPRSYVGFFDNDGETNTVTVTNGASGALVIKDSTATITSDEAGCVVTGDGHTATCTPAESTTPQLSVSLGDGNDTFTDSATIPSERGVTQCNFDNCTADPNNQNVFDIDMPVFAEGGKGDDTFNGNDNAEEIYGDYGNDTAHTAGGADLIFDVDQYGEGPPADQQPGGGDDHYFGGAGPDFIYGGDGNDELRGEDGDDYINGRAGTDTMDGGGGFDAVDYSYVARYDADGDPIRVRGTDPGATVTLNAAAATNGNGFDGENDSLAGIEDVLGSQASDTITGSAVSNALYGNGGNDTITGGAGNDRLTGDFEPGSDFDGTPGDDTINAADNEVDAVDCGGDGRSDKATVDNIDSVRGCDSAKIATNVVAVVTPPAPVIIRDPADTIKAKIAKLKAAKKLKTKTFKKKGKYAVTITANEAAKADLLLESKAGKKAIASTNGYVALASKSKTLAANKATKITLTVAKKLRRQFKKGRRLQLKIRLTDAGGNITTKTVKIKLS